MQCNKGTRRLPLWVRGFAALCAALTVAAAGSASAAPTETVLHSFTGSDGATLQPGLIADSSGDLYGMTTQGGASGQGVVFKLAPAGTFRVLYSFCGLGLPAATGLNPSPACLPTAPAISMAQP